MQKLFVAIYIFQIGVILGQNEDGQRPPIMAFVIGSPAGAGTYPWMVFIRLPNGNQCGGTLLSNSYVLTAAHCVHRATPTEILIGAYYNDGTDPNAVTRTMASKCCHKDFNAATLEHDICIIRLSSPVIYSRLIQKVTLPSANSELPTGTTTTAMGWGLDENNQLSRELLAGDVKIIDKSQCRTWYSVIHRIIPDNHICAGHPEGGPDTCNGDSGGPLVVQQGGTYIIRGITSFGPDPCGAKELPGVYTQVSKYISWINDKMNNPCTEIFSWSAWQISCSVTCGSGTETRRRQCKGHNDRIVADSFCGDGLSSETGICTRSPCQRGFTWRNWKRVCDVTCGDGVETHTRQCIDGNGNVVAHSNCPGDAVALGQCRRPPCLTFAWGSWNAVCSVTCGRGIETQTRQCRDGQGNVVANNNCPGDALSTRQCHRPPCSGYRWGPWQVQFCSVTCGEGTQYEFRHCENASGGRVSPNLCTPGGQNQVSRCMKGPCVSAQTYRWGPWQSFCSVTCGIGTEHSSRACLSNQNVVVSSSLCTGSSVRNRQCRLPECSSAGLTSLHWGQWKNWSPCRTRISSSSRCNGFRSATRNCISRFDDVDPQMCIQAIGGDYYREESCTPPNCF